MHVFVRLVGLVVWNTRAKGKGRVGKPSIEWTSPFVDHGQRLGREPGARAEGVISESLSLIDPVSALKPSCFEGAHLQDQLC